MEKSQIGLLSFRSLLRSDYTQDELGFWLRFHPGRYRPTFVYGKYICQRVFTFALDLRGRRFFEGLISFRKPVFY